jgi:hypothetical protein
MMRRLKLGGLLDTLPEGVLARQQQLAHLACRHGHTVLALTADKMLSDRPANSGQLRGPIGVGGC